MESIRLDKSRIFGMSAIRLYDVNYEIIHTIPGSYYREEWDIVGFFKEKTYGNNFINFHTIPIYSWDDRHFEKRGVLYDCGKKLHERGVKCDILTHFYINQMDSLGYCEFGNIRVLGRQEPI